MEVAKVTRAARGTAYISLQNALNFLSGMMFYIIAARILPPEDIGALSALTFIITIMPVVAQLALPTAAAKYISEFFGRGETYKATAVSVAVKKIVFSLSLVFFLVLAALSSWFSNVLWGNGAHVQVFLILSVTFFLVTIRLTYLAFLQGLQWFGKFAFAGFFAYALGRVMALIFILIGYGLTGVMLGWLVGEAVGLPLTVAFFHGSLPKPTAKINLKMLFSFSLPLFVLLLVSTASDWADRMLFLALSHDLASLGVYDLAVRGALTLSIIYLAFSTTVLPTLSEIYGKSGKDAITSALKTSLRYLTYLILPAGFGLAAISKTAMALMFGAGYATFGRLPLAILSLATAFLATGTVLASTLQAIGETKVFVKISLASIAADILVIIITVPVIREVGAALARVTLWLVLFTLTYIALNKRVHVELDKEALWKGAVSSVIMIIPLLGFEVMYADAIQPAISAIIEIGFGMFIYGVCLFAFKALHKQDFEILQRIAPAFSRRILKLFERFFVY